MKKNFSNPEPKKPTGPSYWRSLDEVAKTPGFQEYLDREFPEGASVLEGVDRRHFIKIMAASSRLRALAYPVAGDLPDRFSRLASSRSSRFQESQFITRLRCRPAEARCRYWSKPIRDVRRRSKEIHPMRSRKERPIQLRRLLF